MKTATVTWIKHKNLGTYLQAFALQKFLINLGLENAIINDEFIVEKKPNNKLSIKSIAYKLLRYPFNYKNRRAYAKKIKLNSEKDEKFESFKQKHLIIENNHDYKYLNKKYDVFICGSDQIWSPRDRIFNEYFFLRFSEKPKSPMLLVLV